MPEASLLTDDVRALVGRESPAAEVVVTAHVVRRALETYGASPRSFAPGDPVPGYAVVALESGSPEVEVPLLLPRSLLISNDFAFARPLRLGERLFVRERIADISERLGGRFGYSIYVRTEHRFRDETGAVVATAGRTMMQYEHEGEGGDQ